MAVIKEETRMGLSSFFTPKTRTKLEYALITLIVLGVCLRVFTCFYMEPTADGSVYSTMGNSFAHNGEFVLPYGETFMRTNYSASYSHHYPPLYPMYLAGFYYSFGFSVPVTQVAALLMSLLFVAVIYFATKDLFGQKNAMFVTAIMSLEPTFIISTGTNYSENLVGLLFVLTMWAVIRALKDPNYMIYAGLFAGLGYLSKSTVDYFFIIAGICGLLWRFYYDRWAVFKNKGYIGGIILFGLLAGTWMLRNLTRFGWPNWQTSDYAVFVIGYAGSHLDLLFIALVLKLLLFAAFFCAYAIFFQPELVRSVLKVKRPVESCLLMSIGLMFVLSWFMTSAFWTYEQSGIFWLDNYRYIAISFVPLLWLVVKHRDPTPQESDNSAPSAGTPIQSRSGVRSRVKGTVVRVINFLGIERVPFKQRVAVLVAILVAFNILSMASWTSQIEVSAAEKVAKYAGSNDIVAVDEIEPYYVYPYIVGQNITIEVYHEPSNATYIISGNLSKVYQNYTRVCIYKSTSTVEGTSNISGNYTFPDSVLLNGDTPHVGLSKHSVAIWMFNSTLVPLTEAWHPT